VAVPIQVVFDCVDPAVLAEFWASALDYVLQPPPDGFASWPEFLTSTGVPESDWNSASAVVDPAGAGPRIYFQRVPEPKQVKNRVHLDVNAGAGGDLSEAERRGRVTGKVEQLMEAGATVLKEFEERGEHWIVMQDPEGNEFCVQ
jgi:hypothetical protein